jgi:hypothetical protein
MSEGRMLSEFLNMTVLGFLIGLTGALAPGPTLIATINASRRSTCLARARGRRWQGKTG